MELAKTILNFLVDFGGIGISIYGLNKSNTVNQKLVFWVLVISFIVIILHNIFTTTMFFFNRKKQLDLKAELEEVQSSKKLSDIDLNGKIDQERNLVERCFSFDKKTNVLTNDHCSQVYDRVDIYYQQLMGIYKQNNTLEELLKNNDITIDEYMASPFDEFGKAVFKNQVIREQQRVKQELLHVYKEYLGSYLREIHDFFKKVLITENYNGNISLSIKLCDKPYNKDTKDQVDSIKVSTAFRYSSNNDELEDREVWEKVFSINKNSDFHNCLTKDSYIENNLSAQNGHYMNENPEFLKHYNCTVVVPIIYRRKLDNQIYGFLCCDTLCDTGEPVFVRHHADFLYTCAVNIGNLLDTIRFSWVDVNEYGAEEKDDSFFEYNFDTSLKC